MTARAPRRRLWAEQAGFTMIELLVAATLALIVMGAAFDGLEVMTTNSLKNATLNDSQQGARQTIVLLSRQLRNLAGPDAGQPEAFDSAGPSDVVFKTVDPNGPNAGLNPTNVERVRYCLDPAARVIWQQTQTWTSAAAPGSPSTSACPGSGWTTSRKVAQYINNNYNGQSRPLFLYDPPGTDVTAIRAVRMNLWVDATPGQTPNEVQLESGVFLRNQNRPPTSSFQWTQGGNHHVVLNGSVSSDPEGDQLTYTWKDGSTKIPTCDNQVVCDWNVGAPGTHNVTLEVRDPAGLLGTFSQSVVAP